MKPLALLAFTVFVSLPSSYANNHQDTSAICGGMLVNRGFLAEHIRETKKKVMLAMAGEDQWTSCQGSCWPYSLRIWERMVERYGNSIRLGRIDFWARPSWGGGLKEDVVTHAFVVDYGMSTPVIIDSTYLQFIRAPGELGLDPVFVGTQQDLIDLFTKHRQRMVPQSARNRNVDPSTFVNETWPLRRPQNPQAEGTYNFKSNF